jgi:hypothetical protein
MYCGGWQNLHLMGLESGSQVCVGTFGWNLVSVNVKMFLTFNLIYKYIL